MRIIDGHVVNPTNDSLILLNLDPADLSDPADPADRTLYQVRHKDRVILDVSFQRGSIEEDGVNGVTDEVLLEIVLDRLRGREDRANRANQEALNHIEEAKQILLYDPSIK